MLLLRDPVEQVSVQILSGLLLQGLAEVGHQDPANFPMPPRKHPLVMQWVLGVGQATR